MKLYKIFRRTPFFLSASHWISKKDNPIKSSKKARSAVLIPLLLIQFGSMRDKLKAFKIIGKQFVTSIKEMRKSAKNLPTNPKTGRKYIDTVSLIELENYIRSLGISQIGYTKVNPDFIFNGFNILYDNAIIITMEMERPKMRHNPSDDSTKEIWRTYSQLGIAVNKIAEYLRERGYDCHPSPAVGGDVMTVPIAEDAGLGAVGKNGLLITPKFGPSQRLAAIFVDIENLPLKSYADNKHLWIKEFCETCNHCVKSCPGKAIHEKTKILDDGYPEFIEREKCAPAFSKNCSICISSCPFFNGNYEKIKLTYEKKQNLESVAV